MYPPQAVRQVILAVDRLVARGDVAEVAGLLHAVWWGKGLKRKQAMVAVHFCWYICPTEGVSDEESKEMQNYTNTKTSLTLLQPT